MLKRFALTACAALIFSASGFAQVSTPIPIPGTNLTIVATTNPDGLVTGLDGFNGLNFIGTLNFSPDLTVNDAKTSASYQVSFINARGGILNVSTEFGKGNGNSPHEEKIVFDDGAGNRLTVRFRSLQVNANQQNLFLHEKITYEYSVLGKSDPQVSREYDVLINIGVSGNPAVVQITPATKFEQLREAVLANAALSEKLRAYVDFNSVTVLTPATLPAFAALTLLADSGMNMQEIMDSMSTKIVLLGFWGDTWDCTAECTDDAMDSGAYDTAETALNLGCFGFFPSCVGSAVMPIAMFTNCGRGCFWGGIWDGGGWF
jgi:hypothetical protein